MLCIAGSQMAEVTIVTVQRRDRHVPFCAAPCTWEEMTCALTVHVGRLLLQVQYCTQKTLVHQVDQC